MRYDLATMANRARKPRRKVIFIRPIHSPAMQAANLYRAAYAPIVAHWQGAIPAIMAAYERTLSELQNDSAADVSAEIAAADNGAVILTLAMRQRLERWAEAFARWHSAKWRANVFAATGVDLSTIIGPADTRETVQQVIERNVGLVKSVSDQSRERMADAVYRAMIARTPSRVVAKELQTITTMSRRRALNIASDQGTKLASALDDERRRQAGIDSWVWVHSEKARPRPEHVARNGFLYTDNPARVGTEYEGKTLRAPPDDRPGYKPYCGCVAGAVLIID